MSRRVLLSVIIFSVVAGVVIGYMRALPDDFTDNENIVQEDYGYRCGDGTEFTLVPTSDLKSLLIVPATSADYIREAHLRAVSNTRYEAEGVALVIFGDDLVLSSDSNATTTCKSMRPASESLFHLTD